MLSAGSNQDRVCSQTGKASIPERHNIMTEVKGISYSSRKQHSSNNSQYGRTESSFLSVITSKQPPSGKRAFLCGVSYKKQKMELQGTTQDLKNMKRLLVEQFSFPTDSIISLAEEESYYPPTRKNIENALEWLMRDIQCGDSLVFYFSGHGLRQRDLLGDEIDGYQEEICPLDFQTNGMISDNYINTTIVRPLIPGVTLHAIVDSCHSGTILDLPHVYDICLGKWDDNHPPSDVGKGTSGGRAICFSACEDYQQAADTSAFSPEKEMTGAMTCTFIKAIKGAIAKNQKITYQGILDSMHQSLKQEDKIGCLGIRRVFERKIFQDPLLSSSDKFDTNTEFKL